MKKISVIGLGYVGLPLYNAIAKTSLYNLIGFDIDKSRIIELNDDFDRNYETDKFLKKKSYNLFTSNSLFIKDSDIFIIVVPTPINAKKLPKTKQLKNACKLVSKNLKKNSIVIFESTVYPGLTEEICVPILKKNNLDLKYNIDFFCGYSPERINPGDKKNNIMNTEKIVSGSNHTSMNIIKNFYRSILNSKVHVASSIKNAEAAKVLENTQRDVNIALMNEYLKISKKLNFDFYEVLKLASTKWNFNKFYPGLVGGHCIGVDPYYLIYKSKKYNLDPKVISFSRKTNQSMTKFIFSTVQSYFKNNHKRNPNILFLGVAYKKNTNDLRNSLSLKLIQQLIRNYKNLKVYDPLVYDQLLKQNFIKKGNLIKNIFNLKFDLILLIQDHNCYEFIYKSPQKFLLNRGKFLDLTNKETLKKINILC